MNLKTTFLTVMAGISINTAANIPHQSHKITKKELIKTLNPIIEEQQLSSTYTTKPEEQPIGNTITDNISHPPLQTITIQNLEGTPFRGEKKMIKPNYGNLLGYSQAETIMKKYNSDSPYVSSNQELLGEQAISFPLIYPELREYFPQKLSDLVLNPDFKKYKNQTKKHTIVVSRCNNGKVALAYYEDGMLKMTSYVSPGTENRKTISGGFPLNHSSIFRRSKKYRNSAMPYAIQISGGYFLHQGRSNGYPQSHGCIRVPGLYQKWLYEHLPRTQGESVIILEGIYSPTLNKITDKKTSSL